MKHPSPLRKLFNLIIVVSLLLNLLPATASAHAVSQPVAQQAADEPPATDPTGQDAEPDIFFPVVANNAPILAPTPTPSPTPPVGNTPIIGDIPELVGTVGPEGGDLSTPEGYALIHVPANAVDQPVELRLVTQLSHMVEQDGNGLIVSFDLRATDEKGPVAFAAPLDIRFELGNLLDLQAVWEKPERLRAHRYDLPAQKSHLVTLEIDQAQPGSIVLQAEAPGLYFLNSGDNLKEGWKLLFNDAQVALFSGGATYDVPIDQWADTPTCPFIQQPPGGWDYLLGTVGLGWPGLVDRPAAGCAQNHAT
jgi:hypothetical protein